MCMCVGFGRRLSGLGVSPVVPVLSGSVSLAGACQARTSAGAWALGACGDRQQQAEEESPLAAGLVMPLSAPPPTAARRLDRYCGRECRHASVTGAESAGQPARVRACTCIDTSPAAAAGMHACMLLEAGASQGQGCMHWLMRSMETDGLGLLAPLHNKLIMQGSRKGLATDKECQAHPPAQSRRSGWCRA